MARRPDLWAVAFRQWRRTVPTAWWRRRPFLPVPTSEYLAFRLTTQYGADGAGRASDRQGAARRWGSGAQPPENDGAEGAGRASDRQGAARRWGSGAQPPENDGNDRGIGHQVAGPDVVDYLTWCKGQR